MTKKWKFWKIENRIFTIFHRKKSLVVYLLHLSLLLCYFHGVVVVVVVVPAAVCSRMFEIVVQNLKSGCFFVAVLVRQQLYNSDLNARYIYCCVLVKRVSFKLSKQYVQQCKFLLYTRTHARAMKCHDDRSC